MRTSDMRSAFWCGRAALRQRATIEMGGTAGVHLVPEKGIAIGIKRHHAVKAVLKIGLNQPCLRAARGEFDAVIAPYHDVGMAAFKTASFGSGVNVTLGLPFPRTSPDHGTALDLAGRGVADASSMNEALALALRLAQTRRHSSATAA